MASRKATINGILTPARGGSPDPVNQTRLTGYARAAGPPTWVSISGSCAAHKCSAPPHNSIGYWRVNLFCEQSYLLVDTPRAHRPH
jgi:hypothetical protein